MAPLGMHPTPKLGQYLQSPSSPLKCSNLMTARASNVTLQACNTPLQESFIPGMIFFCTEAANVLKPAVQALEVSHRHIKVIVPYPATPEARGIFLFLLSLCSFEYNFKNCRTSVALKIVHLLKSRIIFL